MRFYTDKFVLTPGPTEIPERIKRALLKETTNPDLDPEFLDVYNNVRGKLKRLLGVNTSDIYIMVGEAILGLEIAIANTVKPKDKVIVIANGVYGEGFGDFVKMYGGIPVYVGQEDWRRSLDLNELDRVLEKNKDAIALTLVHCDTPSALLNDLPNIAKVVKSYGLLIIVDAVSSIGGMPINLDDLGLDILIGGSQKALNLPPGVTIIAVSKKTWDRVEEVKYSGFYLSLSIWRNILDEQGVFPYTMSESLVYALDESLNIIFEEGIENVFKRHEMAKEASWRALEALNLEPYPLTKKDSSPTVTAFISPKNIDERILRDVMWRKYGIMLAGSWGKLKGKVVRIGHMGVQASRTHLIIAYTALAKTLKDLGLEVNKGKVIEAIEEVYT
ncbi:MAG: alanine--glyoxylate aminotransferase family protein [Ignisphaera sp.]